MEDRDPVPTFGGGDRAKMTPGIIPERSMAPSVGSSRKIPSVCGPPPWLSGWEERQTLVLWVGLMAGGNAGRRIVVAEWAFVNLDFRLAELHSESCQKFWRLLRCGSSCHVAFCI